MKRMGHGSLSMTDRYTHGDTDRRRDVLDEIAEKFAGSLKSKLTRVKLPAVLSSCFPFPVRKLLTSLIRRIASGARGPPSKQMLLLSGRRETNLFVRVARSE
jgi:hypothetical protein